MIATHPQSRQLLGVNQQTYQSLKASISLDLRRQLLIAVCDSVEMQAQIAAQLEADVKQQIESEQVAASGSANLAKPNLAKSIEQLLFDADDGNLPQQIANWMRHALSTVGDMPRLQVLGIEQMTHQPAITQNYFLRSLDKIEALLPQLNTSLLVWVPWPWLRTIQQSSPTFWNWRNGVFEFVSDPTPTPAKREALDIDLSMFEPERKFEGIQGSDTKPASEVNLGEATFDKANLNGSVSGYLEETESQNGHSPARPTVTDSSSNNIASPDLSEGFDSLDAADLDTHRSHEELLAALTLAEEPPASTSAGTTDTKAADTDSPFAASETISEAADGSHSDLSIPLDFWDDDDFPLFDTDIADIAEIESSVEQSSVKQSSVEQVQSSIEQVERADSVNEHTSSNQTEAFLSDSAPSHEPNVELKAQQQEESSELLNESAVTADSISVNAEASDTAREAPAAASKGNRHKGRRRNLAALGGLRSVVSQGINLASVDEEAHSTSLLEADSEAISERNLPERDVSEQDISERNVSERDVSERDVSERNVSERNVSERNLPKRDLSDSQPQQSVSHSYVRVESDDNPAALLDALSHQSSSARTTQQISTDIPVLVKEKEPASSAELSPFSIEAPVDTEDEEFIAQPYVQPPAEVQDEAQTDNQERAAQCFAKGLAYRHRIEAGERGLEIIDPAIAAYEEGLAYLRNSHPDRITGLNDLGTLYWLKAQQQSDKAQAVNCMQRSIQLYQEALEKSDAGSLSLAAYGAGSDASGSDAPGSDMPGPDAPGSDSEYKPEANSGIISQLHSNMGAVFTMLATCEEPVPYLTQAAESYQRALPMVSLSHSSEEYATLYNSLGSVYWKLSHYESADRYLHQAIAAYTEALSGYSAEHQPLDYAAVQNNLGITYWSLAKHEQPETLLKRAIAAYRDALNYRTSDVDPAACAISYNNLALAYWDLAKHTHQDIAQKSRYQKNAITAFEAALNINNLSGALSPMDSAAIYHCLGDVHAQMTETAPSAVEIADSLQKSLYSYVKSIENLSTDSPAYPPRFGAIVANLRLHYDKLGLEGQQNALNRIPASLLPQVMMAL